jgi:hypothetical protein
MATPGKHLDFIRWYEPSGRIDECQPDRFATPLRQYAGRVANSSRRRCFCGCIELELGVDADGWPPVTGPGGQSGYAVALRC